MLEFIIPLLLAIIVVELGVAIMRLDAIAKKSRSHHGALTGDTNGVGCCPAPTDPLGVAFIYNGLKHGNRALQVSNPRLGDITPGFIAPPLAYAEPTSFQRL
jgi:hypothetical protein